MLGQSSLQIDRRADVVPASRSSQNVNPSRGNKMSSIPRVTGFSVAAKRIGNTFIARFLVGW
jgi:hypothetical protein